MTHYGIVGGGKHPASIIEDGIKDIFWGEPDHTLYLHCRKGATESEKVVYNYVLDNQIPFTAVASEGAAPKVLVETADHLMVSVIPESAIIKELAAVNGTLLIMWDEEQNDEMSKLVTVATDLGVTVLELSNGLTPILLEEQGSESEHITETVVAKEVELEPLTTEELSQMSRGLLEKAAFAQGISDAKRMNKEELVDTLAGYDKFIASSDLHVPSVGAISEFAVITWYENGIMQVAQVPTEKAAQLLGRC